jgi:hypothetical protein
LGERVCGKWFRNPKLSKQPTGLGATARPDDRLFLEGSLERPDRWGKRETLGREKPLQIHLQRKLSKQAHGYLSQKSMFANSRLCLSKLDFLHEAHGG